MDSQKQAHKVDARADQLHIWAQQQLPSEQQEMHWQPLAGDASLRRYFRLITTTHRYIAVDAPNTSENNTAFIAIAEALQACHVKTPIIFSKDYDHGFLLIEDFGDQLLSQYLTADQVDHYYRQAYAELIKIQQVATEHFPAAYELPEYDRARLRAEMNLFHEWFIAVYLDYQLDDAEQYLLEMVYGYLEENALMQPYCFVHRDYHSRNIMLLSSGELGIIDFQDGVWGPVTYDLVSLLRDCYVKWPKAQVEAWALGFAQQKGLLAEVDSQRWLGWFNGMGLQRHIKVAGIFARLYLRDQKSGYLPDIPRVMQYILEVASEDIALTLFVDWLKEKIIPRYCAVYPQAASWFHTL